jgi:hypothetical protein
MNFNTIKKTVASITLAGAFILIAGAGAGSSVFAQDGRWRDNDGWRNDQRQQRDGYYDGLNRGRQDARDRRRFDPDCNRFLRDADRDYREGFRRGYGDGFRQADYRWDGYRGGYGQGGYGQGGYGQGGYGQGYSRREQDGYNDGMNRGREDARDHRRFDPNNSEHFRDGDGEYRDGFRRGYAIGFRQYDNSRRW